jgi:hypothetical protein
MIVTCGPLRRAREIAVMTAMRDMRPSDAVAQRDAARGDILDSQR